MVEFQPSKLAVVGSNPIARSNEENKDMRREALFVNRETGRLGDSQGVVLRITKTVHD